MTDLVAAGLAAHARRAWLARAKAAPIPPPPAPRGRHVSVEELDDAVAAALARGRSSLEEHMARVHVKLVPEPSTKERRAPCVVCGLSLPPAVAGVPVCGPCADSPDTARARLEARRAGHARALEAAAAELDAALEALDAADRARWGKVVAWRLAVSRGARWAADTAEPVAARVLAERASPADAQARLDKIKAAINGEDARVSAALRRAWFADEVAFWARAGAVEELRRTEVAAAHLEAALAAMEPAEPLAFPAVPLVDVPSTTHPGLTHKVAADGSWCSCEGFRFRKACRHADTRRGEQAA